MAIPVRMSAAAAATSYLRLVPKPQARNLGDLLHDLARRPKGSIYIAAITQWVEYLLRVLPQN